MDNNTYELTENDFVDLLSDFNYQIESSLKTQNISLSDDKDLINSILNKDNTLKNSYDELDFLNSKTYTKNELKELTNKISLSSKKDLENNDKKGKKGKTKTTSMRSIINKNKPSHEDMEILNDIINSEIEKYGESINDNSDFKADIVKKYLINLNIDIDDNDKFIKSLPNRLKKFVLFPNLEDYLIPYNQPIIYVCIYHHKIESNDENDKDNKYIRIPFLNYVVVLKDNGSNLYVKSPKTGKKWGISKRNNIIFMFNPNHNY